MALVFNTPKSALNTTSKDIQNLSSDCPPCPEVNLTTADVEYTENGEYTVTPEEGYDGLTQVDITVNVPMTSETITVESLGTKTFTPSEGGFSSISVSTKAGAPSDIIGWEQNPFVSAAEITELEEEGVDFNNMSTRQDAVWIALIGNRSYGSATFDGNNNCVITFNSNHTNWPNHRFIVSPFINGGWPTNFDWEKILGLKVYGRSIENGITTYSNCEVIKYETLDLTSNGTYSLINNPGYWEIEVNVPSDIRNQDKLVVPTTSSQTLTADSGYSGIGTVSVEAVTSSIDANIAAGNIKKNVSILGVTGSYDPQPDLETKTVTYTTNDTYTITPTAGKDGMSSVEVTVNVTGSNCPDWSTIGWDCSDVAASSLVKDIIPNGVNYHCINGMYEQKITSNVSTYSHSNFHYLRYLPIQDASYINNNSLSASFSGCDIVDNVHFINTGSITDMSNMFNNCYSLTTFSFDDTSAVTDMSNMFAACVALTTVPMMDTSSVTNMNGMFNLGTLRSNVGIYKYNKMHLTTIPQFDTSNVTNVGYMFNGGTYTTNDSLTTLPELNFVKVDNILSMLDKCTAIANLGGFINLGKGFTTANNGKHQLNLSSSTVLTKQSIMNVINNLAAPDDTAVTDASLKLSATSYALLDASDIAIATAKGWNVISA